MFENDVFITEICTTTFRILFSQRLCAGGTPDGTPLNY